MIGQGRKKVQNRLRDFIIASLHRTDRDVHYVHVGANDGRLADPVFKIAKHLDWSGLLIEPNPLYFSRLERLHANRPKMDLLNCGISDVAGNMILYHLSERSESRYPAWAAGCASLDRDRLKQVLARANDVLDDDIAEAGIFLRRLDEVLASKNIETTDLLVIDVEGHELNVLNSFDLTVLCPKLMLVEVNLVSPDEEVAIMDVMKSAGYTIHRFGDDLLAYSTGYPGFDVAKTIDFIGFPRITP